MTTEAGYELSRSEIDTFIAANDDRAFLSTWVEWWHARRCFIFRAFAPKDAPRMNQAEVIHDGWAHRERPNLSMLDAFQADTRDSLLVEIELEEYLSGATPGGKGPSYADLRKNKHAREMKKAKRLGSEMFSGMECGQLVDPQSSHCPRANQRKRQNKSRQQKHQSNFSTPSAGQSSQTNNAVSSIQRGLSNVANSSCYTATNNTQHGVLVTLVPKQGWLRHVIASHCQLANAAPYFTNNRTRVIVLSFKPHTWAVEITQNYHLFPAPTLPRFRPTPYHMVGQHINKCLHFLQPMKCSNNKLRQ